MSARWRVVAALFVLSFTVSNGIASFGVFLPALADAFGWSRGTISLAFSLNLLIGGFAGFGAGALADRHGPRGVLLATIGTAAAGFALASTIHSAWQLYLFIGVMGGIGASGFYVIGAATVSRWFERDRGLALGIVLAAFSVSYITGGPTAAWLVEHVGWRSAYLAIAAALCVGGGGSALLVRDPPSRPATASGHSSSASVKGMTLGAAFADRRFWSLTGAWVLSGAVSIMISVHVVSHLRDRGLGLGSASLVLTAYGLGTTFGRLGFSPLSDRLGSGPIMRTCIAVQVVALAALPFGLPPGILLLAVTLFGIGFTGADSVFVRVIPEVFGLRAVGAIMGVLSLGWRLGAAIGPAAAGYIHDATGSYALPFAAAPVAIALSYVLFVLGSRPQR